MRSGRRITRKEDKAVTVPPLSPVVVGLGWWLCEGGGGGSGEQNLAPLRIPFKDILIATKDFAKENLIDQGGIADVYKGLLLRSGVPIDVVIRRFCHPEYIKTKRYDRSDAYSLGVILLEVLCGKKATIEDVIRYRAQMELEEGKLDNIDIAPNLREQMHTQSLSMLSKTAYDCLKEERDQRPSIDEIVKSLQIALELEVNLVKHENRVRNLAYLRIPLREITMATNHFADTYLIRSHIINDHVYEAELNHFDRESVLTIEGENKGELPKKKVIIKRIYNYKKSKEDFFAEIEMISSYKHPNLVSLLGFCDEGPEMIVVFECAFKETLHYYLKSTSNRTNLTWERRIRICLDIAHGLKYLHKMIRGKSSVIHQRIQSANVLFDEKWTAKIVNFKLFEFDLFQTSSLWDSAMYTPSELSARLIEDDIYSLGLILFEILTGRLAPEWLLITESTEGLVHIARSHFNGGTLRNIADPGLL
ncbi:hypothetical protein M8C21_014586, partial [Ambrosia artemisiifolia]